MNNRLFLQHGYILINVSAACGSNWISKMHFESLKNIG